MGTGRSGNYLHTYGARNPYYTGSVSFMEPQDKFLLGIQKRRDVDPNGYFDVIAHGTPKGIQICHADKNIVIDSRTAARYIRIQNGYKKGGAIRLLSCNTGQLDTGFAQNLANKMNVRVIAPSKYLWVDSNGHYFVAGITKNGNPDLTNKGKFRVFYPHKRKKEDK